MTSTHIERYIELGNLIHRNTKRLKRETNLQTIGQLVMQMNDAMRERNDLWDALEFRVPELT